MRRLFILTFFLVFLLFPTSHTTAQTAEQLQLFQEIQQLLARLETLKAEVTKQVGYTSQQTRLLSSEYYSGPYEAIYLVEDGFLEAYSSTIPTQEDRDIWNLLTLVWGEEATNEYISEYRLYRDNNAPFDAFVEQQAGDDWIIGVNLAGVHVDDQFGRESTIELFVHEYAHILHQYNPEAASDFEARFWDPRSRNSASYVSTYAMQSAEEDFAESFMFFVLNLEPDGNRTADKKVDFFYDYDAFWDAKEDIRDRLY